MAGQGASSSFDASSSVQYIALCIYEVLVKNFGIRHGWPAVAGGCVARDGNRCLRAADSAFFR